MLNDFLIIEELLDNRMELPGGVIEICFSLK